MTFRPLTLDGKKHGTTVKIFSTGALTLLGRVRLFSFIFFVFFSVLWDDFQNVALVNEALDLVYPLMFKHKKTRSEFDVDYVDNEDEEEDEF